MTTVKEDAQANLFAILSLVSIAIAALMGTITHFLALGSGALGGGLVLMALIIILGVLYRQSNNKVFLIFYGLLNVLVILGFGLFSGFWNHAFKVLLNFLHNGTIPSEFAGLFADPKVGSFLYEGAGTLAFVSSMFAAYYLIKLVKRVF